MKTSRTHFCPLPYRHLFLFLIACFIHLTSLAQGPLTANVDPLCTTNCCSSSQPCNCTAGVLVTGGIPPYSYTVWSGTNPVGYAACVPNLCPGTYVFEIRDAANNQIIFPVTVGLTCCTLNCADTTICFEIPDSSVVLLPPSYTKGGTGVGGGTGPANPDTCGYDSIWSNAPGIYPVGTTVVTWYVSRNGQVDSCMQNVIRNPPTVYAINFTTSPPIVAGVINICNGQSITFNDNSTGTTGRLWNFGNGFYSTNAVHTEPPANYPPGTYYDTLTVYDACGFAHDTAFVVIVDSASGPDIFCISVVCPGDTVTYHTNANCTTYTWSVINGTFFPPPTPTSDSVTVIWGPGPQGTISLSVSGCTPPLNCPFPTTKIVHIVPATMPIAGDTIVCAGSESCYEVECIPGNAHSWELMPANAGTVTGQGTCRICVQWAPGFFGPVTIQLNYQNVLTGAGCTLPGECTNDPGCGGVATITVDVRPIFGISGPAKVCPNAVSAPFNGMNTTNNTIASGVSWKLVTPVPSIINFPNTAALNAYTWNAGPGIYKLTAYAPPNIYCNDSAVINVEVVNMLVPNAISGPDTVCANVSTIYSVAPNMAGVTYVWNVIGGVIVGPANGSSVTIQWNPGGGSVSVVQMLSAAPFCASASSPVFNVTTWPNFPLPVVTSSNPIVCMNSTITYYIPTPLLSNATYTWSIVPATAGNILSANGTDSIVIKWISAAITPIFVKLKISRCYEDSVMVPINLLPLPTVPNITYFPANPCVNTTVNFSTLNPGPLWNWSFGDAGTSIVQNPTHIYTAAGNYNVQLYVTNASGCSDTATTAITVEDIPVVPVITGPDSVCINALASYGFSQPLFPGAYYSWSLSNSPKGIISSSGNNFMNLKWTVAGTDTVKVRVQANCLDTTIKYVVVISPLPTPGISVVSPACQNSNVNFTGSGGGTYSWSFAGGSPGFSSSPNPVVTYGLPGNYNVSLTVVSAAGCAATATTTMSINPEPIAIINGPYSICSFPGTVTMNAVAQPGYTFLWSPTGTTGPSVTTTISSLTTFSCVVTNSFGCTRLSNAITVDTASCTTIIDSCQVNDSIDFTYTPPICLTQQYTKIYTGTLTGWNFGAGGSAGAVSPVSATYPYPGVFPVTVVGVALGTYPDGSPCNKNISRTRNVTIPFDPDFDFDYQCNGSNVMQVVFTNTSQYLGLATAYNWTWFDATYAATLSTNPFPPALTLAPGTHVINLSVFDPATGASCTITKTINVPLPIVASFTVSSPLCVGAPNTFTNTSVSLANQASMLFNNGNGGTATTSPASIPYAASGSYTASLAVTDIYGCTSSASQPVTVTPAGSGTITVGALACDSVSLTASGPGPFTWNVISPPPVPNNPAYVKTSGFYSVTGIGVNGCPYTAGPVQVTVNKSPQVTITGTTQYCQGEALNIKTSAAGVNYAWIRLPSTPVGGNSPNLNIIANTPGTFTYQVTVTAANGCTGSATYTINVDPVPGSAVIVASGPLTFCDGDSIKLSVTPPGFTYLWSKSPAPAIPSPQNANPDLWVTTSGTYSVIVQTANGCAYPAIAPVTVVVNPKPPVAITGNTTLCEGKTLTLQTTPVGGGTYLWIGPTGTGVTNPFVLANIQLADAGPYTVVVTNAFGCTATATVNVVVNPSPVPPIIVSNPGGVLCQGQMFNLSVSNPFGPPIVYNWSTGQMGTSINVVLPATYSVTATNQFGCKAPSNAITLHPRPDLSCVPSGCYEFCDECDSVNIPGPSGLFSYNWQVLVGNVFTFYSASQNLMVYPPGGKFRLMGANQWGCADSTDTLDIEFNNCCPLPDTTLCLDTCVNFNDNTLQGWQPFPGAPNVGLFVTNSGSQAGPTDFFVMASDLAGPSQLETGYNLRGKWCCGEFCFDYKVFDDGVAGVTNVNPIFRILNGSLGFVFTSSTVVNETMGWQNICAPITDCNPPPSSPAGVWTPIAGTTLSDWTTVLSNVTNVLFRVDFSAAVGEASGFDNVCINSNVPSIDAGNDTTVCAGSVISLHVEGCSNNPEWYAISGDTLIFVGNGPLIDVAPTQNTCYVVICCGVGACCCDTDTVCVNVNQLPILQWNTVYPSVCQNSAPIVLDSSQILVFVNNNWVPVSNLGGSGVFSGPFVTGNIFTPSTIGTYTICYTYTDSVGCSNQICNTINVIFCCDTNFQISAGNDTTICHGGVAVLNVSGCNGAATWYKMSVQGPIVIGQGPLVDVTPTQNTCYMVVCCDPLYPACCDTDTVCVFVNELPILQWNTVYPNVCQNSAPIVLDSSQILVFVNNNWVPVSNLGGSGVFSGPFVTGNIFTPSTIGTYTICYTYTDSVGCSNQICNTINVIFCCDTSFQISAGNDTTICHGGVAVLNVSGCNGSAIWYALSPNGPVPVGQGPILDALPQTSTCYMVVCCDPLYPACCDTDTVCVYVNELPILQWNTNYPSVCQNSAPIYLDSNNVLVFVNNNWVPVSSLGGSGVFSGPFVTGNIFTPSTIGTYTICYTYTDSVGCSNQICNTINVIFCCDTSFQISAGNDTTICHGGVAVLNVSGCNGSAIWYALSPNGPVPVGQGPILDALPQTSTCYMVVCCDPLYPACCDTDTVCVYVNELPILQWNTNYPSVCQNSAPIYLDSNNVLVFVNNNWVPVSSLGGSGVFSGPFVTGNIFTPSTIGTYTICYTYTDSVGCSNQICNTINVIFCCDTSFQISAGNDTTICAGGVAILQVDGCMGTPTWYMLTGEGPIPVVQGQIFDVFPQVNTCYMVVCCDTMYPACCDTDTVCVFVNAPPVLTWPTVYPDVCQNGGSITLNPADIFVDVNNTWVMSPFAGGTGVFSGTGVVGNTFTPGAPGLYTICFTYTDSLGCSSTICNTINVIFCCDTLSTVSAGNDTTICAGGVAILTATGCAGTPTWHILTGEGPVPVVQGAIFDVFPQTSTCYMVICCDPLYPACCDTDTVCVFVNPLPVLSWPTIYTDICNNGGPITLNPADVFVDINNTWVMSPFAGGTGVFSGPGVFGNTFTPPGIGSYVITFTYTDANGCVTTISNSITVIFCCDTLSTVSAGNDTTICAGGVAILTATGCTGNTTWYQMGVEGPFVVGQGPVFDALPQQSTCYMVVCCDPLYPACCDTDTVCVYVGSQPVLSWPSSYPEICQNGGPITLNPADIFVDINNTWVMSPFAGGTGVFSGTGVVGNTFTPGAPGLYTICFTFTNQAGCSSTICKTISVIYCCDAQINISAGNDTTICSGSTVTIAVTGCSSLASWYWLTAGGPAFVGSGPSIQVGLTGNTIPVTACYMVVCCDPVYPQCCDTDTVCVTILPVVSVGPITGTHLTACLPAIFGGSTYSVPAVSGATYQWTVPAGMSISSGQGTPTITTTWTNLAMNVGISGQLCVYQITPCGVQLICTPIDLNAVAPVTPPSISGPAKVCPGNIVTYSVAAVARATSYNWTLPAGMTITSGAGTNVITVSVGPGFVGGTIVLTASNACGTSPARTKAVMLNPPLTPGPISGPSTGVCGTNGAVYTIVPVPNAVSYLWTVTNGTIVGANTGTSIVVNWNTSFTSAVVSVRAVNGCGMGAIRTLNVSGAPATPGPITGPVNVCSGATYHYSTATVAGASQYTWVTPGTIVSGQGTKDIDVVFNTVPAANQVVSIRASNPCGNSAIRVLNGITISFCIRMDNSDYDLLSVYPNPAHEQFEINYITMKDSEYRMDMIDAEGRVVWNMKGTGDGELLRKQVDVTGIARGLYLIRLNDEEGVKQLKIIIN